MRAQHVGAHHLAQQGLQGDGAGQVGLDLASALFGQADIDHLHPQPPGLGHKVAAREGRADHAGGSRAGNLGLQPHGLSRHATEQRRLIRRVGGVEDALVQVAPLDAQQFAPAAQQFTGAGLPLGRGLLGPHQGLQALQIPRDGLAHIGNHTRGSSFDFFLGAAAFVGHGQPHQQRLGHHQQADQGRPQQNPSPTRRCGRRGGRAITGQLILPRGLRPPHGLRVHVGRCGVGGRDRRDGRGRHESGTGAPTESVKQAISLPGCCHGSIADPDLAGLRSFAHAGRLGDDDTVRPAAAQCPARQGGFYNPNALAPVFPGL